MLYVRVFCNVHTMDLVSTTVWHLILTKYMKIHMHLKFTRETYIALGRLY